MAGANTKHSKINLSVNVNKIALLRNSRGSNYPDLIEYSKNCIDYGADGITVHPRSDCRHITPDDVIQLARLLQHEKQHKPYLEFNIEGNPFAVSHDGYPGFLKLVEMVKPDQVTLVPDAHSQLTSDHGFNLLQDGNELIPVIQQLRQWNCRVSLFMEPDIAQIQQAKSIGADRIELYTGHYAISPDNDVLFNSYNTAANCAAALNIGVNAGHDLSLANIAKFALIDSLQEVSIGHALVVEAIDMGLKRVIANYQQILNRTEL